MKKILEGAELIVYLIKKVKARYPEKQIGKTLVQKLMYLFEVKSKRDFDYTMYHYGPYSSKVENFLGIAKNLECIDISWHPGRGYFIEPKDDGRLNSLKISKEDKNVLDDIIEKYGAFSAKELSIIATAVYAKENFAITDSEKLVDAVLSLKPENKREWIQNLLKPTMLVRRCNRAAQRKNPQGKQAEVNYGL